MWHSRTHYVDRSVFYFSCLLVPFSLTFAFPFALSVSTEKRVSEWSNARNWSIWSIKRNARQLQKKNKILSPQKCDGFTFLAFTFMPLRSSTHATHMHHFNGILVPFQRYRIPFTLLLLLLFSVLLLLLMLAKLVFLFDNWKSITITDESEDARVSPNIIEHYAISQKMVFYFDWFDWLKISNVSRIKLIISSNTHHSGCICTVFANLTSYAFLNGLTGGRECRRSTTQWHKATIVIVLNSISMSFITHFVCEVFQSFEATEATNYLNLNWINVTFTNTNLIISVITLTQAFLEWMSVGCCWHSGYSGIKSIFLYSKLNIFIQRQNKVFHKKLYLYFNLKCTIYTIHFHLIRSNVSYKEKKRLSLPPKQKSYSKWNTLLLCK